MKRILYIILMFSLILVNFSACSDDTLLDFKNYIRKVVDVDHTPVERQLIGNCWIYASASWAESMYKRSTGENFDISQSYWTYMDWFTKILNGDTSMEDGKLTVSLGGLYSFTQNIIRDYGLMEESKFIKTDSYSEQSYRQSSALKYINKELNEGGRLYEFNGRDRVLLREVLDDAWNLDEEMKSQLTQIFGKDLGKVLSFSDNDRVVGTDIIHPSAFKAYYNKRTRNLAEAVNSWKRVRYSAYQSKNVLRRVKKALHDGEPVIISWMVDFNAFEENRNSPLYGSFNEQTLLNNGSLGSQGGHMTTLKDYEAKIFHKEILLEQKKSLEKNEWYDLSPSFRLTAGSKVRIKGNGDADLYLRRGAAPTKGDYDCRPYSSGSEENCDIDEDGEYYVSVSGYKAADITITVEGSKKTEEILKAGDTLDPKNPEDKIKLDMLLDDDTEIIFFRTKNSWGGEGRPELASVPYSEKGYHDLYMDYLDSPFRTVDNCREGLESEDCGLDASLALTAFVLPPEYYNDPELEPVDPVDSDSISNLLQNGSFEDSLTEGWTTIDSGIELEESADAYEGEKSLKVIVNTRDQGNTDFRQYVTVEPGETYTFSMWVKNTSNTIQARIYVAGYTNYSILSNSEWQLVTNEYTATHGAQVQVGIRFYDSGSFAAGDEILLDAIKLIKN